MSGSNIRIGWLIFMLALFPMLTLAGEPKIGEPKADKKDEAKKDTSEEETILQASDVPTNFAGLQKYFGDRTYSDLQVLKARALIKQLGAASFRTREKATAALLKEGTPVLELLQQATLESDPEVVARSSKCIEQIKREAHADAVPIAAARVLARLEPKKSVGILLDYIPFSQDSSVDREVINVLAKLAVTDGKPAPDLVAGLKNPSSKIRAACAEILTKAKATTVLPNLRKLLEDPVAAVRLRTATGLAMLREKDAIPVMIGALPKLTQAEAWKAEALLLKLATNHNPPTLSVGRTEEEREKARKAWSDWWAKHKNKVDMARLSEDVAVLGYTAIVLLDQGQVVELGEKNEIRWRVGGLSFPLDLQMLPGDRFLVAEYNANKGTERNIKGEVLWEREAVSPQMAQRLPNGNTVIGNDSEFIEVDRQGKLVNRISLPNGDRIMKGSRLANGDYVALTESNRVVRLDSKGKEIKGFDIFLGKKLFGGRIEMTPSGNVLIPHHLENKVVEYDINGRRVWEVRINAPIITKRLANGNVIITSMDPANYRAVEFNRKGEVVWEYRNIQRVTRAVRR